MKEGYGNKLSKSKKAHPDSQAQAFKTKTKKLKNPKNARSQVTCKSIQDLMGCAKWTNIQVREGETSTIRLG